MTIWGNHVLQQYYGYKSDLISYLIIPRAIYNSRDDLQIIA